MHQGFLAWLEIMERDAEREVAYQDARRAAPRFPFHAEADVRIDGVETGAVVTDVSVGGIRLTADEPLPVGSVCELTVHSPSNRVYRSTARIVWTAQSTAGLAFI